MGAIDSFLRKIGEAIQPDRRVGIAEWSEQHRILPESSPEPGEWRNARTPYLIGIMDALSGQRSTVTRYAHDDDRPFDNSWVTIVGMQKGHQLGGSALGENFIGRNITSAAGNILAVFATKDDAEKWEMDRFEPMRTSTRDLRRRVKDANRKGSANTKLRKRFPGGIMNLVSATRAGRLKSTTVRYVLLEEVDEYELNVDGQGNPIDLAINRTSNFGRRAKIFANSTPTIKRRSQIEKLYERGDQRRYFVACPECGVPQFFEWKNFRRVESDPQTVLCYCTASGCGVGSPEHAWKAGYDRAYWMPTARGDGKTASFHLSALYAPLGWRPWDELMDDWEAGETDIEKRITFTNNALAECWEDKSAELKWETIKRRAEPYALRTIPRGCLVLTGAVDTQNDRLEVKIVGWGRGLRASVIDYVVIRGDPSTPEPWNALDALLDRPITNTYGVSMRIELCAVDTGGHRTQDAYDYCRTRGHRGVFAIKGASTKHRPIIGKPTAQDVKRNGQILKGGVMVWPVGTDTAKDRIFGTLTADEDRELVERRMHFSEDLPDEYFEQLCAEAYNPSKDRWDRLRKRNEALDLMVYNYACAYHPRLRLNAYQDADWMALEVVIEPRVKDLFSTAAENVESELSSPTEERAASAEAVENALSTDEPALEVAVAASAVDLQAEIVVPEAAPSWVPRRDNWLRR